MYIDSHCHFRDEEQKDKETIAHGLRVALDSGLEIVIDMPNTARPVTTRERVLDRFKLALQANSQVIYGTYIGLTADKEQIREAVKTCREFAWKPGARTFVAGIKAFWGKSVGDLSITSPELQRFAVSTLADLGYEGVLAGHYEKESLLKPELFNPKKPETWNLARPEEAEIFSLQDIVTFAMLSHFNGKLHVCHVSTPLSVQLVSDYKHHMKISCEVSPHHLLLDTNVMQSGEGILYKVNPSLRSPETREELFAAFLRGDIDTLASDHAPHTLAEKLDAPYLSGIPNVASWRDFVGLLSNAGAGYSLITKMTFDNPCKIFNIGSSMTNRGGRNRVSEYVFDPYACLK
ncbi:MAG: amidohydrolase family protein [Nanoarchaeota archaeon]|nr:amidohydrolase family protein [Nanoarchaeota archaeon]MBU4086173.1 amidohydrolase family protein [Nanoarchaeota archaeon]